MRRRKKEEGDEIRLFRRSVSQLPRTQRYVRECFCELLGSAYLFVQLIRSLSGVDRCSLSWWSRRGLLEVYEDHWSFSEQFSIMTIYLKSSMITSNPKVLFRTLHTNTLCNIFLPAIFTCITELQIILTPLDFHPKDQWYISQPHIPPTRPTTMVIS